MSAATPSLSILIPVYRSEASLKPLVSRLMAVLDSLHTEFEIMLVNDGSPDRSWDLIQELSRSNAHLRGINLMRNFGQHNALLCGIREARHEVIVTLDADLQNPPEEIPRLLEKLAEGHDVVYGTPHQPQHGIFRDLSSWVLRLIARSVMRVGLAPHISAFRAFRTQLRDAFAAFQGPFVMIDVLLTWGTTRFASVPVRHDARSIGKSSYSLRKLFVHGFNVLTGFSTLPLQLASWIGFFFTLFGLGVLVYVIGRYLILGYSFPGFPFLASIIAIFSGAQLFALGIIGEYLARMHFRLMERPPYVMRQNKD
ncbi:MAG: glycosyltransferase family 2 protein [Verrucomicrobia bacterium]|nr:glycosyltransferase family 2 protein [Verrucomicrobiota bacterium]MBU4248653.1 glycosyltransferase family 2 protein [Verrucomicrobiota bacterium]MBU4290114.1 glycosyltransferase family 2 protein [Verrucomicrobiota bacterium]MCG2679259.1 glycosyltransferase family 2 protein [Kiritimatiellia bacterium]